MEALRWARENGCPGNAATRNKAAAKLGYADHPGNRVPFFLRIWELTIDGMNSRSGFFSATVAPVCSTPLGGADTGSHRTPVGGVGFGGRRLFLGRERGRHGRHGGLDGQQAPPGRPRPPRLPCVP